MSRERVTVALAGTLSLAGCINDPPQAPPAAVDPRLSITVDTDEHLILHPPLHHKSGQVDPVDQSPGRERDFGPQSRLMTTSDRTGLLAALQAVRSDEPPGSRAFFAVAKPRAAKTGTTESEATLGDEADPPPLVDDRPAPASRQDGRDGGTYRLNFEDAEIKDVLQAVLGNVLGLSYTIAPNVSGRITISSAAAQGPSELLSTLETVLALQGLSMTKAGSTYKVAPAALGGGAFDSNGTGPGFGITVVPLAYTSVASMNKLLAGFIAEADGIRVDSTRNAIIVRGPGPRREEIVRAIKSFDSDWMHTQSVSVFQLRRSRPDEIVPELSRIFDSETAGDTGGVIKFKAMKRLRSIMVLSKNPQLVARAGQWIRRLDHQDTSATDAIFVYRPRYRDAKEMVKLVNGLFSADTSGGSVAFQQQGQNSQGQGGQPDQSHSIGSSTAPFAGGLSSGVSGGVSGNGAGQVGGGFGGLGGAGGGPTFGASAPTSGSGLTGTLAEPIEPGQSLGGGGSRLKLTADASNNTIVAYTDGETYDKVQSILRQIDVAPLQVAVNVIVAEVQLNDELKYGVQFYLNNNKGSIGLSQVLSTASAATTAISPQAAGFNFLLGGPSSPNVVINALDSISKVHILSTPSIVVTENKPAVFEVGNQVPVVTQTATSTLTAGAPTLNQVTYLDTGIILRIIPRVGQNGDVAMDLDQVISSVVPDATGSTTASLTPTISKRHVSSAISVRSGQSVLLAGLINDTKQVQHSQVPFIGDQLGDIFGNRDNVSTRDELIVFIRPVIVRNGQDASDITREFKSHLKEINVHGRPVYKP